MSTEHLDIEKYLTSPEETTQTKKVNVVTPDTAIRNKANITKTAKEWFTYLNDKAKMPVHCMLSPESHKNNDENASCSINKNGDYLNIKCFVCKNQESLFFGKEKQSLKDAEFIYVLPDFNREEKLHEVKKGLTSMEEISAEVVRLLPELTKKEKEK